MISHNPDGSVLKQPMGFLRIALWFGLLTGFGEIVNLAIRKFILHRLVRLGPAVLWMAPLADVCLFAIPGLALSLIAWRWPKLISLRTAAFLFAFLTLFSWLLMYSELHQYASMLIAAGLAVQTARVIAAHAQGFHRLVWRTTGWMAAIVLGLAVVVHGWDALAEHRALAKLPAAPASSAPNVLLIVLDTVRAESLSLYGNVHPTTPNLERLAKTGVVFDRALSTAPWTSPSHATMFTGHFPHELSVERSKLAIDGLAPLDATYPTLAEVLRENGYLTAGFVANVEYCGYESGLDRGFVHYEDFPISTGEIILSSTLARFITHSPRLRRLVGYHGFLSNKSAAGVNRDFLRWLPRQEKRPFFAFLNYMDAHEPYLPPDGFEKKFGPQTVRNYSLIIPSGIHAAVRHNKEEMSKLEIQAELDAYEGSIAYLDHHVGLLLGELEQRGALDNTLVIITSDHGELFGEHSLFTHGNSLYLPLLHVPLLVSFPARITGGKRVAETVSLRDLPATVLAFTGLQGAQFPGSSLARYCDTQSDPAKIDTAPLLSEVTSLPRQPSWHPVAKGDMKSLLAGRYHYIKNGDGKEELYDIENDPSETQDLARSGEKQRLEWFRTSLEKILVNERTISGTKDWTAPTTSKTRVKSDSRQATTHRGASAQFRVR